MGGRIPGFASGHGDGPISWCVMSVHADIVAKAISLRRSIHQHPEIGFEEFETTRKLAEAMTDAGIAVTVRSEGTGLIAEVGEGWPMVGFRADLDALPIQEANEVPYKSARDGLMHACGHDVHAAIAVGIALNLARSEPLPGRVRFIFQPGEEQFPGGARFLIAEGATEGLHALIAFHVDPSLDVGMVGLKPGPITSSSDRFVVTLEGPGGHTARPHETVDTLYAAGKVLTELPGLIHRAVDPRVPLALVFGSISGGDAANVIPSKVTMSGTCRLLDRVLWERMPILVEQMVHEIVAPTGAKVTVEYTRGIPPVVNDPGVIADLEYSIMDALGREAIGEAQTSMGAEDFADYLELVPGALIRLGVATPGQPATVALHSSNFDIDEGGIEVGIEAGTAALLRLLEAP